jgi:hypothetical protein
MVLVEIIFSCGSNGLSHTAQMFSRRRIDSISLKGISLIAFNHLIVLLSLSHIGPGLTKDQVIERVRTLHQILVLENGVSVSDWWPLHPTERFKNKHELAISLWDQIAVPKEVFGRNFALKFEQGQDWKGILKFGTFHNVRCAAVVKTGLLVNSAPNETNLARLSDASQLLKEKMLARLDPPTALLLATPPQQLKEIMLAPLGPPTVLFPATPTKHSAKRPRQEKEIWVKEKKLRISEAVQEQRLNLLVIDIIFQEKQAQEKEAQEKQAQEKAAESEEDPTKIASPFSGGMIVAFPMKSKPVIASRAEKKQLQWTGSISENAEQPTRNERRYAAHLEAFLNILSDQDIQKASRILQSLLLRRAFSSASIIMGPTTTAKKSRAAAVDCHIVDNIGRFLKHHKQKAGGTLPLQEYHAIEAVLLASSFTTNEDEDNECSDDNFSSIPASTIASRFGYAGGNGRDRVKDCRKKGKMMIQEGLRFVPSERTQRKDAYRSIAIACVDDYCHSEEGSRVDTNSYRYQFL